VTIKGGLDAGATEEDPPTFGFELQSLTNPRGLITSGMFNITIYTQDDDALFYFNDEWGPNVTMRDLAEPQSISYSRSSSQNGVTMNLTFDIRPTNYVEPGDFLMIDLPRPIHVTEGTKCIGVNEWTRGEMECSWTGDLAVVDIKLSVTGRYRRLEDEDSGRHLQGFARAIPAGQLMRVMLTNVSSPASTRPSYGVVSYSLRTSLDEPLEELDTELDFANTETGEILP